MCSVAVYLRVEAGVASTLRHSMHLTLSQRMSQWDVASPVILSYSAAAGRVQPMQCARYDIHSARDLQGLLPNESNAPDLLPDV